MSTPMTIDFPLNERPLERKEKVLDAVVLNFDLSSAIEKIKNEIAWKSGSRDLTTLFRNPSMKIELFALHTGAKITPRASEGIMSLQVLEGIIKFRMGSESLILIKGQMLTLHKNVIYEVRAMEEAFFLLTVSLDRFDTAELQY